MFPSSPQRPPESHFYVTHPKSKRFWTIAFSGEEAPARWLAQIIDYAESYEEVGEERIIVYAHDSSVVIREPNITRWLTKRPGKFQFPEYCPGHQSGRLNRIHISEAWFASAAPQRDEESTPKPKRAPKQSTKRTPRAKRDDSLISVADVAAQMNITPPQARAALRKSKTPKPDVGWAWAADEVDNIKAIIKSNLK